MNSVKVSICKRVTAGFSLLEVVLVVGLTSTLVLVTAPVSMNAYKQYQHRATIDMVVQVIRVTQFKAQTGHHGIPHGVKVRNEHVVVFEGNSYDMRDQTADTLYEYYSADVFVDTNEVVFDVYSGAPSGSPSIAIGMWESTSTITIHETGLVTYE